MSIWASALLLKATVALSAATALAGLAVHTGNISCVDVKSKCLARKGCVTALGNVLDECIAGRTLTATGHCAVRCEWALVSLASVEDGVGRDYLSCHCSGNEACLRVKSAVAACMGDVLQTRARLAEDGGDSAVSCHLAWMLCQADTSCSTALTFYERLCGELWRSSSSYEGYRCTRRCGNSVNVLYRQPKAARLKGCYCDDGDRACALARGNTARLCPLAADQTRGQPRNSDAAPAEPQTTGTAEQRPAPAAAPARDGESALKRRDGSARSEASRARTQVLLLNYSLGAILLLVV